MSEMTALQRLEQKLMQGGAALPVPIDANGVENGLSIALLLVREEMAALAAAPAAAPRWIPVSERLPEPKQAVLVAKEFDGQGDWRIKVGGYAPDYPDAFYGWHIFGASWEPSHWMPLPAPPAIGAPAPATGEQSK